MNLRTLFSALLATAVAVLWCSAPASATLVLGGGEIYTDTIEAESSNAELDGTVDIKCSNSTIEGAMESHGPESPVSGKIGSLTFSECGKDTVTVIKPGTYVLNDTGTLISNGAEITVQLHRTIFGFPITSHCIYATSNTDLGIVTDSSGPEAEATMDIDSAAIPQPPTDGACGNEAELTGSYTVTTPLGLVVAEEVGKDLISVPKEVKVKPPIVSEIEIKNISEKTNIGNLIVKLGPLAAGIYKAAKTCDGKPLNAGQSCTEKVECKTAGFGGLFIEAEAPDPLVYRVTELNC